MAFQCVSAELLTHATVDYVKDSNSHAEGQRYAEIRMRQHIIADLLTLISPEVIRREAYTADPSFVAKPCTRRCNKNIQPCIHRPSPGKHSSSSVRARIYSIISVFRGHYLKIRPSCSRDSNVRRAESRQQIYMSTACRSVAKQPCYRSVLSNHGGYNDQRRARKAASPRGFCRLPFFTWSIRNGRRNPSARSRSSRIAACHGEAETLRE